MRGAEEGVRRVVEEGRAEEDEEEVQGQRGDGGQEEGYNRGLEGGEERVRR